MEELSVRPTRPFAKDPAALRKGAQAVHSFEEAGSPPLRALWIRGGDVADDCDRPVDGKRRPGDPHFRRAARMRALALEWETPRPRESCFSAIWISRRVSTSSRSCSYLETSRRTAALWPRWVRTTGRLVFRTRSTKLATLARNSERGWTSSSRRVRDIGTSTCVHHSVPPDVQPPPGFPASRSVAFLVPTLDRVVLVNPRETIRDAPRRGWGPGERPTSDVTSTCPGCRAYWARRPLTRRGPFTVADAPDAVSLAGHLDDLVVRTRRCGTSSSPAPTAPGPTSSVSRVARASASTPTSAASTSACRARTPPAAVPVRAGRRSSLASGVRAALPRWASERRTRRLRVRAPEARQDRTRSRQAVEGGSPAGQLDGLAGRRRLGHRLDAVLVAALRVSPPWAPYELAYCRSASPR